LLIYLGFDLVISLAVKIIGNTLGGILIYYLGYPGKMEWIEKYAKVKKEKIHAMITEVRTILLFGGNTFIRYHHWRYRNSRFEILSYFPVSYDHFYDYQKISPIFGHSRFVKNRDVSFKLNHE